MPNCPTPCAASAHTHDQLRPLFRMAAGLELLLASASPRRRQFLNEWGLPFRLALSDAEEPRPQPGESPEAYTRRAAIAKALAASGTLSLPPAANAGQSTDSPDLQPVILAADTVVAVDGDILGKPDTPAHAMQMLERLNGRGHEVISAVCLLLPADMACGLAPAPAAESASHDGPEDGADDVPKDVPGAQHTPDVPGALPGLQQSLAGRYCMLTFSDTSRVYFHHWPRPVLQAYLDTGEPHDKAGAYAIQGQGAVLVERVEGSWSTVVGLPVTQLAQVMLDRGLMLPCA